MSGTVRSSTLVLLAVFAAPAACLAQESGTSISGGLSGSLSDPLLPGSETSGFNGTFDASTASFTNPTLHADVNDPTHAQLAGSSLSPLVSSGVSAAPQTTPQTGTLSDAQASVGLGAFGFGGHRNASFAPAAAAHTLPSAASQTSAAAFGALAARSAFSGGAAAMSAFSGRVAGMSTAQFSGEGAEASASTLPLLATPSAFPVAQATSLTDTATAAGNRSASPLLGFTDPVLTNSAAGYDTGPEIHGDLPTASSQTSGVYASYVPPDPVYQYDDGQTPAAGVAAAGAVLGGAPAYTHAATGFPDSTRGTAGATDPFAASPRSSGITLSTAGPFPPVSEGTVFEPRTRLSPDLHTPPMPPISSFEAYEQKLRRFRLAHGASISQADVAYQQDLRQFHRNHGRERKSSLTQSTSTTAGFQLEEKIQVVR